ncbi:hypothetical protein CLOSTASPAR_02128 [[Clostridium] asparagiforme DSM 15981]|uniref:Uncharacterized protein n=1 Tax=[Clostridium] asparagiforme DSM 15981 TaxID=518636 RepID=C0CYQ1_9FIRM|nr:hypothetical protein CLOSTASPAR_02128 [[Clostridium] asparagiforme DSM 15981]
MGVCRSRKKVKRRTEPQNIKTPREYWFPVSRGVLRCPKRLVRAFP